MIRKISTVFMILIAISMQGCATYSTPRDELISKVLVPPKGQALIYIIRAPGDKGRLRAMPFSFNEEKIGDVCEDQYMYVHAWPMQMLLPQADGSVYKLTVQANRTYYLQYGFESSFFEAVLDPFTLERPHFNVLSDTKGKGFVNKYRLSGEFRRVIIGRSTAVSINETNLSTISNDDNLYEYIYENNTKKGSVTVTGTFDIRNSAINKIKDICLVKNIAILTNSASIATNASFLTLSEKLTGNKLHMQFECIY